MSFIASNKSLKFFLLATIIVSQHIITLYNTSQNNFTFSILNIPVNIMFLYSNIFDMGELIVRKVPIYSNKSYISLVLSFTSTKGINIFFSRIFALSFNIIFCSSSKLNVFLHILLSKISDLK